MTESESAVLPLNDSPVGNVEERCLSGFYPVDGWREYNAIDILCQQIFFFKLNLYANAYPGNYGTRVRIVRLH